MSKAPRGRGRPKLTIDKIPPYRSPMRGIGGRPLTNKRAIERVMQAEKWETILATLGEGSVLKAEYTGGDGRQWRLSRTDGVIHEPVYLWCLGGAVVQGGGRIKGYGLVGAIEALDLTLAEVFGEKGAEIS